MENHNVNYKPQNNDFNSNFINKYLVSSSEAFHKIVDEVFQDIKPYLANRQFKDKKTMLAIFLVNLIANMDRKMYTAISLNKQTYPPQLRRYRVSGFTYRIIKQVYEALRKTDYIERIEHNFAGLEAKNNRATLIYPEEKLVNIFNSLEGKIRIKEKYPDPVIRKDEEKNEVDYRETSLTKMRRKHLKQINQFTRDYNINVNDKRNPSNGEGNINNNLDNSVGNNLLVYIRSLDKNSSSTLIDNKLLTCDLHSCYSPQKFPHGGRLYTGGFGYQTLPKVIRKNIRIDCSNVTELDFDAHHVNLLYAQENLPYPEFPYIYNKAENRRMRNAVKFLVLIAINADSKRKALGAFENKTLQSRDSAKRILYCLVIKNYTTLSNFYDSVISFHKPIGKYIGSGYGIKLQDLDGQIMLDILVTLMNMKIIALGIHDSVIVRIEDEQKLREVMSLSYEKIIGCPCAGISKKY
jgi:hypothetical protein